MKETLHIKNFGPIKEVKLELGNVNVLIGDQGTGKSTVAKLLHIIYSTGIEFDETEIELDLISSNDKKHDITLLFLARINRNGLAKYLNVDTYISYEIESIGKFTYNILKDSKAFYHYLNEDPISDIHYSKSVYIPAERMFISTVFENIFALNQLDIILPDYFLRYAQLLNRVSSDYSEVDFSEILGIKYKFIDGKIKILKTNSDLNIDIKESSSGVQTLMPIYLYLHHLLNIKEIIEKDRFLLSIEELEMNSFPYVQNETVKKIIEANYFQTNNKTLLTTHSPYLLTSLNNLMYAYSVGQNHTEKVSKIIEEKYWLNPEDVSAYMMLTDGTCEDIMDREEGMIKAEKIDEVSNVLSEQFDELMNIENNFKKHEL